MKIPTNGNALISQLRMDNTEQRAGGLCCQMKNMNFPRAGELHRRADRQATPQDGQVGCTLRRSGRLHIKLGCGKGQAGGLPFSAVRRTAFFVQPAGPLFCLVCSSPPKIHLFCLETQPFSPPGPPISVIC